MAVDSNTAWDVYREWEEKRGKDSIFGKLNIYEEGWSRGDEKDSGKK